MDDVFIMQLFAPDARPVRIQDPDEAARWFAECRTYSWMVEEYERRYNIATTPTLWESFRRNHGLTRRAFRGDELIPWTVHERHRRAHPLEMLLLESRRRSGAELTAVDAKRLDAWTQRLTTRDLVVHYDPA